jgi:hypothetical protein
VVFFVVENLVVNFLLVNGVDPALVADRGLTG